MSTRCYAFKVDGLPPKKDAAKSMWATPAQIKRLVPLRRAALAAFGGDRVLSNGIRLTVVVRVGPKHSRTIGDLDALVSGICDGLMRAHEQVPECEEWREVEEALRPGKRVAIEDDYQVVSISATKVVDESEQFYTVLLEGEDPTRKP